MELGETEELLLSEYRVSVWNDGKVLETDTGDGHLTLWM
jgi:hypothetical protein